MKGDGVKVAKRLRIRSFLQFSAFNGSSDSFHNARGACPAIACVQGG